MANTRNILSLSGAKPLFPNGGKARGGTPRYFWRGYAVRFSFQTKLCSFSVLFSYLGTAHTKPNKFILILFNPPFNITVYCFLCIVLNLVVRVKNKIELN